MEYSSSNPTIPNPRLTRTMQELLDRAVGEDPSVENGVLSVEAPGRGFRWKGEGVEMLPDDRFRSASVGKMVLATTAMKLVEEGTFGLDEGIGHRLSPPSRTVCTSWTVESAARRLRPANSWPTRAAWPTTSPAANSPPHGPPFVGLMMAEPDRL